VRYIVFINFNEFYVHAIRQDEPALLHAPLAVIKNTVVLDVSAEASHWGVCAGNTRTLACRRCPDLVCIEHNPDLCADLFFRAWSTFSRLTPQVEPMDLHVGFLDLTGCFGQAKLEDILTAELWRLRFETGLESTWGGGQDKWLAHLACGRNEWIPPQSESAFLNRVSIRKLALDGDLCERLERYGINSVGSLFRTPRTFLQSHLQLTGKDLQPLFRREASDVRALFPPPVVKAEVSLQWADDEEIARSIGDLAEDAARQLAECHQQSGFLRVTFRSRTGEQCCTLKLAKPARKAATFETILQRMLSEHHPRDLRRITLILDNLSPAPQTQGDLWQNTSQKTATEERFENARQVLDKKYGHQTVQSGSDYASQTPPRFAQLIYARRGTFLP